MRDIRKGVERIRELPARNPVRARRPQLALELRRQGAAQFAIIYAYLPPSTEFPGGVVSIRAIRHRRVKNVFAGVREGDARCPTMRGSSCRR